MLPIKWARWAALPYPILIRGERGTGKSRLAGQLHRASGRRGPFIARSLAEVPPGLAISEVIGHRRGVFTSAVTDHDGILTRAKGGTAFLDELGSAGLEAQGALLSFLDHGRVRPIGGVKDVASDARLIAATNSDLEHMVASGQFLPDLIDRFGFYVIWTRPLRDRRDDILPLVKRLLLVSCELIGRSGVPTLSREVVEALVKAPWPGNVRDVVKVSEYLAGNAGDEATLADLPPNFLPDRETSPPVDGESRAAQARRILSESNGVKSVAARRMGFSRAQFYRILRHSDARDAGAAS
jgi:DNA-binding NtrC family response regulator